MTYLIRPRSPSKLSDVAPEVLDQFIEQEFLHWRKVSHLCPLQTLHIYLYTLLPRLSGP